MSLPSPISVQLPTHLTPGLIARLARDVVMEFRDLPSILEPYCITTQQFERIKELPYYKRVAEDFALEWNKVSSTAERIKLISQVMLEEGLPRMGAQMVDKEVSPAVAVETGKFFAKLGGVGEVGKGDTLSGEKFVINISLGDDTKLQFTQDAAPQQPSSVRQFPEGEAPTLDLDANPEGAGVKTQIQQESERHDQLRAIRSLGKTDSNPEKS